eukprot:5825811-Prorocentrum_lima.AAC.1
MCNKYTKRHVHNTQRPLEQVYPEVYRQYLATTNWALTNEDAFSEDEQQAPSKRDVVEARTAEDKEQLTQAEKNRKTRQKQ